MALPKWLIKSTPKSRNKKIIREILGNDSIHTVCESAMCPNIGECYSKNTVTFMILGNSCTRSCSFCAVAHNGPEKIDHEEPKKVAEAAKKLGLKYVVVTSVTRDDLSDGGANHFAKTINALKIAIPSVRIEVLIPDLQGNTEALSLIVEAKPNTINHNLETVKRLYKTVRPQADYNMSLNLLKQAKFQNNPLYTKSGIMLGLGEQKDEVIALMNDLRSVDCDILTIGQYLRPSSNQIEVKEYVVPKIFEEFEKIGTELGFKKVFAGPFVRSSYRAGEINV